MMKKGEKSMKIKICGLKAMPIRSFRETRPEMIIGPEGHMYSPGSIWFREELKRLAEAKKEAEMKHQRKMDSILNGYICEMSEGMMSLSHVG